MSDLLFGTIDSASLLIKKKELSPVELTKLSLAQIQKIDSALHAFITVAEEEAIEQAMNLEEEAQLNKLRGPLHGIPVVVKDILQTAEIRTTGGSKVFQDWVPSEDATTVEKLKKAGAIIIGKANLHEFAMGATTENPHYGSTKNPWDLTRIPGGIKRGLGCGHGNRYGIWCCWNRYSGFDSSTCSDVWNGWI